jgi:phthiodiolone/phenolphthiodiolone dimycocerosates ketoreductase
MAFKPATLFRTTLPLDLSLLADLDGGRFHSIWLPDHLVSLWPDAIWTPEFTDLATTSPSPHRHLDAFAVAAAAAAVTKTTPIVTTVVDTARRHPAMIAQTALTIDHVAKGRFILGLGSGEMENTVPYGFDFATPVSRFEEALQVIRLLWESDRPVDFEGRFYHLHHARMDAEPYDGKFPQIWIGCSGPRMLEIAGRQAEGWMPVGSFTVDGYVKMLAAMRRSAERAGRDPAAITTAGFITCLIGEPDELAEMVQAPLVKAFLLQVRGDYMRELGFAHPLGEDWKGIHDINPVALTRARIIDFLGKVDPKSVLGVAPHGTPKEVARIIKGYVDAGMQVPKILDYGGMAGLKFGARSAAKVREAEDELIHLVGEPA